MQLFAEAVAATHTPPPDFWHTGAMGYMIDGGPFMWPILVMAILGVAVVIERFRSLRLIAVDAHSLRTQVLKLLHDDQVDEAIALCACLRGPVPAILAVGLHRYELVRRLNYDPARIEEQVVQAMDDYGVHVTAALEKNLAILSTIATVAPMVGSLGTVVGMVVMFQDVVNKFGLENIIILAAKGIKMKLIVTVWGLMVGIPAYIFFNYFTAVVNRYILEAEETATQLIEALAFRLATPGAASRSEAPVIPNGETSAKEGIIAP